MRRYLRSAVAWASVVLACSAAASAVLAQEAGQPPRVELIVGNAPGGAADNVARILQRSLVENKLVTSPIIVLNKPGGDGDVALSYLAQRSKRSGDLAVISITQQLNYIMGTSQYQFSDFTPVAILIEDHVGFAVKADSSFKTGRDLIDALKKDPASVSIAITGFGGVNHLPALQLAHAIGVDGKLLKTPVFDSVGEGATALMGGHVDVVIGSPGNLAALAASGRLRILAVTSADRLPGLPDVPTWKELGADVVFDSWRGVWGPKDMKPAEIAFWDKTLATATKSPEWQQQLTTNMWTDGLKNVADTRKEIERQQQELVMLLTSLGVAKKTD